MMQEYVVITVPEELLSQVTRELLSFAADPNHVEVVHGAAGRDIHARPEVAEAWFQSRSKLQEQEKEPVEPEIVTPEPQAPAPAPAAPPPTSALSTPKSQSNKTTSA